MMSTMRLCCCGQTDPAAFITIGPDETSRCGKHRSVWEEQPTNCFTKWHTSERCDGHSAEKVIDALPGVIAESECNPFCLMNEDVIHRKVDADVYEIDNQFVESIEQEDGTTKREVRVGLEIFLHPYAIWKPPRFDRFNSDGTPNPFWFPGGCVARCIDYQGQGGTPSGNECPGPPPQCYELPFLPAYDKNAASQVPPVSDKYQLLRYTYNTGSETDNDQWEDGGVDPDYPPGPKDCTGNIRVFKDSYAREWYQGQNNPPEQWYAEGPSPCGEGGDEAASGNQNIFSYQKMVEYVYEQILYRFGPQRLSNGKINPYPSQVYINIDSSGSHNFEESETTILQPLIEKFREDWGDEVTDWKFNPCYQGPNCVAFGCCDTCGANQCTSASYLSDEDGAAEPSTYLDKKEFLRLFSYAFPSEEYVSGLTGLMRAHFLDTHCSSVKAEGCNSDAPRWAGYEQACTSTTAVPECYECWS